MLIFLPCEVRTEIIGALLAATLEEIPFLQLGPAIITTLRRVDVGDEDLLVSPDGVESP